MMVSNHLKKIFIKASLLFTTLFSLCGCFELGEYENEGQYFDYFPIVELMDMHKSTEDYAVEDYFYTEEGINEFESEIPYKEYLYLSIQTKEKVLLDEVNLSFCSNEKCELQVSVFILDTMPLTIRGYDDPEFDEEENKIEYDDPMTPLVSKTVYLSANKWTSTYVIDRPKNNFIEVQKDQYIVLRFENNSWLGKEQNLPLVSFTTTNLLIRTQGS